MTNVRVARQDAGALSGLLVWPPLATIDHDHQSGSSTVKKILAVASATLMLSSIAGVSVAHHDDDHTQNYHGMCTAYFSGGENGQEKKRDNGNAFGVFEGTVGDRDGDDDVDAYDVADFCNEWTGGFGNPGQGNDPYFGDSDCNFEDDQCEELENQDGGRGDNNGNQNPPGQG